jgi:hypothetical protein
MSDTTTTTIPADATTAGTPAPVTPPKRRPWVVRHGAVLVAGLALLFSVIALSSHPAAGPAGPRGAVGAQGPAGPQGPAGKQGPAGQAAPAAQAPASAGSGSSSTSSTAAATIPGDGTFMVGTDIQPGTYRSTPADSSGGYWERLSGLSGNLGDIIANDTVTGPAVVTIAPSDKAFHTERMNTWTKVG